MKKILMILAFGLMLTGCGTSTESENETNLFEIPYIIEEKEGNIKISNIYIRQNKTEHGYDGVVAIEFDFSELDSDAQYWFEKENSYSIFDDITYDNSFQIIRTLIYESDIQDNKKYIFCCIEEEKDPISEMNCALNLSIGYRNIEIRNECSEFTQVDEFPNSVKRIFDELVLEESGWYNTHPRN